MRFAIGQFELPFRDRFLDPFLDLGLHRLQALGLGEEMDYGFVEEWVPHRVGLEVDSMKEWAVAGRKVEAERRRLNKELEVLKTQPEGLGLLILLDFACEKADYWRPRIVVENL